MQPVLSCLHCQFLCHFLKASIFIKIALKLSYFRKKAKNFQALSPQWPPAAGGFALRPPKPPPNANFWLRAWEKQYFRM